MHNIEPFSNWESLYVASEDERSPFYGREYDDSLCSNTVYNYYIHPQWDEIGSSTLYIKILYADYNAGFCVIELMGEWNDCLHNDIMFLKRHVADELIAEGIKKFVLIGENVLNYHADDYDYYQEWVEDIDDGWIVALNLRDHVIVEMKSILLENYFTFDDPFNRVNWRPLSPVRLFIEIEMRLPKRLNGRD